MFKVKGLKFLIKNFKTFNFEHLTLNGYSLNHQP